MAKKNLLFVGIGLSLILCLLPACKDEAKSHYNLGVKEQEQGSYDSAIAHYSKALELNPKYKDAYYSRGVSFGKKSGYDASIRDFTKVLELDPKDADAFYNRGNAHEAKGDQDAAIRDYTKALELDPKGADAFCGRGNAYDAKGDQDTAIRDYTKAIELNPKFAGAYYDRGIAFSKKGDQDTAILDYTKALELDPKYADAYHNRAISFYSKKDYERAFLDVEKYQELGGQVHSKFLEVLKMDSVFARGGRWFSLESSKLEHVRVLGTGGEILAMYIDDSTSDRISIRVHRPMPGQSELEKWSEAVRKLLKYSPTKSRRMKLSGLPAIEDRANESLYWVFVADGFGGLIACFPQSKKMNPKITKHCRQLIGSLRISRPVTDGQPSQRQ